ncbi:MAG: Glutaredoxin [Bacteroidota bacterium]
MALLLLVQCQTNSVKDTQPKFVMYTKPGCPRCEKSLEILTQRGVLFEERSISDPKNQREMWGLIRAQKDIQTPTVTMPVVYMDSVLYYNLPNLDAFFQGI